MLTLIYTPLYWMYKVSYRHTDFFQSSYLILPASSYSRLELILKSEFAVLHISLFSITHKSHARFAFCLCCTVRLEKYWVVQTVTSFLFRQKLWLNFFTPNFTVKLRNHYMLWELVYQGLLVKQFDLFYAVVFGGCVFKYGKRKAVLLAYFT